MSDTARPAQPATGSQPATQSQPAIHSLPLGLAVECYPLGWQAGLARSPKVKVFAANLTQPAPGVASVPLRPQKLKVVSFEFAAPGGQHDRPWLTRGGSNDSQPAARLQVAGPSDPPLRAAGVKPTRIKPPADAIKLDDRLYYLLQPPLESLLGADSLAFPFRPFAYQFEGVAFLYPRMAAVLADEMGLGKTMQAITAIRMLLHSGELTTALLVCPKPLVTNWQREFALWAPELPVTAIEGDQAKRRWLWERTSAGVAIANYELLQRDRELIESVCWPSTWSCSTKPSGSRTAPATPARSSGRSAAAAAGP